MAKTSVTSIDVARLANVSQSAVSRTFTPGASVSDDTKQRVLDAAKALGYRPNALARSLISAGHGLLVWWLLTSKTIFIPLSSSNFHELYKRTGITSCCL